MKTEVNAIHMQLSQHRVVWNSYHVGDTVLLE